jgi:hypothetical protein
MKTTLTSLSALLPAPMAALDGAEPVAASGRPRIGERLVDLPLAGHQVPARTLTFSDGTAVNVGTPLPDEGTKAVEVAFPPKTTTTLTFTTKKVKDSTNAIGLSGIAVFAAQPQAPK